MSLPAVLPDTNFLMDYPLFAQENWLIDPIEILISDTVYSELVGLSKNENPTTAHRARAALREIETQRGLSEKLRSNERPIRVSFIKRYKEVKPPLDALKPDHQLIACGRSRLTAKQPRFCAILSNDRELSDIGEALSVIVINRANETRFHQELQRKHEWWKKAHPPEGAEGPGPVNPPGSLQDESLNRQAQLERTAWHLARRLRAAGSPSALYIAPVRGRIELVIQTIRHNLKLKNRHTLVVVATSAEAKHWAGELRKRELVPSSEISIWENGVVEALSKSSVNFCHYSQVEALFPNYVNRLRQAGTRLTVLADGCDAMDPVAAAVLLGESDQFFGIKHFLTTYHHTPSSRLMNIALRNNLVLEYTFGDAERDGWGHAFDLFLHGVQFSPDEQGYWEELNARFVRLTAQAVERHPELSLCTDIWETLHEILNDAVDLEAVELIKLREEREQMAQQAQNKASCVFDLLSQGGIGPSPYRRLVFDCGRQWTKVLLNGARTAELAMGENQRQTWDQFCGSQINTLVLSKIPAEDLPKGYYHQLIILTPLRPMSEIMAMMDWALSHTFIKDPLRIDLLYTDDTPEELAMLEVAQASRGINHNE